MKQYLDQLEFVLKNGTKKIDRTQTGVISYFGLQTRYDLKNGFPLLTTKKVHFKSVDHELLWFIKGDTNIKYLVDNGVRIWNEWPFDTYKKSSSYQNESIDEFVDKIKNDDDFAKKWGDLGPIYGKQWRNFDGVDQLSNILGELKNNPYSRRLILSAWNPSEIKDMALPPCHTLIQFYFMDNKLSLNLYQRSADMFLGVPFNIASYALLLSMVAKVCGFEVGEFIHTIGDAHIYLDHLEQVKLQLSRTPKDLPTLVLNDNVDSLFDYKYEDVSLTNYNPHKKIVAKVSV